MVPRREGAAAAVATSAKGTAAFTSGGLRTYDAAPIALDLTPDGGRYPQDGRYPYGPAFYDAANIRARLERQDDMVTIQIDDDRYLDRHERFTVSVRALLAELLGSSTETQLG